MGVLIQMAITSKGLLVMKEITNLLLGKPGKVEAGLMAAALKRLSV